MEMSRTTVILLFAEPGGWLAQADNGSLLCLEGRSVNKSLSPVNGTF